MSDIESHRDYKELINKVKRLTPKEKHHILSIFKKYNIEFTKNSNGYFFNLDKIDPVIIEKVSKCVDLIEQKRELIHTLDKKRDHYLEYYKTLIESKLKDTINRKREQYINQLILIPTETYVSKKKPKFNRVVITGDPDVLMKEHLKAKKYNKNSVYFRLTQKIQSLSRKNFSNRSRMDKDEDEGETGSFNYGDSGSIPDGGGGGDDKASIHGSDYEEGMGMDEDIEESIEHKYDDDEQVDDDDDNEGSMKGDYNDNDEHSDIDDDEYYKDSSSDVETTDMKTDKTERSEKTTKTNKTKKTKTKKKKSDKTNEASSNEIDYYKQILKQSGFVFKEDKIILKKEDYII